MLFLVSKPSSETDPSIHIEQDLEAVAEQLNTPPRHKLGWIASWHGVDRRVWELTAAKPYPSSDRRRTTNCQHESTRLGDHEGHRGSGEGDRKPSEGSRSRSELLGEGTHEQDRDDGQCPEPAVDVPQRGYGVHLTSPFPGESWRGGRA